MLYAVTCLRFYKRVCSAHQFAVAVSLAVLFSAPPGTSVGQTTSGAQSQHMTPNARAQGMGRAFTAIAEGPNATWWNPGGLGLQSSVSLSPWSAMQLVPDLAPDVWSHSYGIAGSHRGVGLGFHLTDLNYGESDFFVGGSNESSEKTILLGAGVDLAPTVTGRTGPFRLGVGVNAKWFSVDLYPTWASEDERRETGSTWDFDLGALASYLFPLDYTGESPWVRDSFLRLRGGLMVKNVFDREVDYDDQDESDPLGRTTHLGVAIDGSLGRVEPLGPVIQAVASVENASSSLGSEDIRYWGVEVTLLNVVSLRRGHIEDKEGAIVDGTEGVGLGFTFPFPGGPLRTARFQYDHSRTPQAEGLDDVFHNTISLSVVLR
ncbi:MAG: hypothetical protein R3E97_12945 [Candidatus Eisenbacteria bacterium]